MSETITIPEKIKTILSDIENVPEWWAEIPLADTPVLSNFNRKLVVSGFNFPDLSDVNDKRAEIFIRQIYTAKDTGEVFINKRQRTGSILASSMTALRVDGSSDLIVVDRVTESELEGEGPVRDRVNLSVGHLDYIRRNLYSKSEHLTFILEEFLKSYAVENTTELDKF